MSTIGLPAVPIAGRAGAVKPSSLTFLEFGEIKDANYFFILNRRFYAKGPSVRPSTFKCL